MIPTPAIISTGDSIEVRMNAESAQGIVLEAEPYRSAWIVFYLTPQGQRCVCTPFPDLPYLPQARYIEERDSELYQATAWFYYKEHIWPTPIGKRTPTASVNTNSQLEIKYTRKMNADPRERAKERIDYVLSLQHNMTADLIIHPDTDKEHKLWKRWWR